MLSHRGKQTQANERCLKREAVMSAPHWRNVDATK